MAKAARPTSSSGCREFLRVQMLRPASRTARPPRPRIHEPRRLGNAAKRHVTDAHPRQKCADDEKHALPTPECNTSRIVNR